MPNRKVHDPVGGIAGAAYAGWRAYQRPATSALFESLGGLGGGVVGSRIPDLLEPACWNHRRTAHSATVVGLIATFANNVESAAEWCRSRAAILEARAQDQGLQAVDQMASAAAAILLYLVAGFLNGLVAGYISHLVLDGLTPASIPLA